MPKYSDFELDVQNAKVYVEQQTVNVGSYPVADISYCYCPSYDRRPTKIECALQTVLE